MIDEREALEQLRRLSGLDFFPKEKPALKELRLALQAAATVAIAERVATDILGYSTAAPKPAQIRAMIHEHNARWEEKKAKCILCGGEGSVTVWILATYNGRSYIVTKQEILKDFSHEKAQEFGGKLRWDDGPVTPENPFRGDNQQIVTGARPCECRKAA